MKNYVQVTINPGKPHAKIERLFEIEVKPMTESPVINSLTGQAVEVACETTTKQLSKFHPRCIFAWGHEESDGRTWIHGVAQNGEYKRV